MENKPEPSNSSNRTWPEAMAIAFSLLAIVISAYALIAGQEQHEDERSSEILDALFEDWDNLSAAFAEDWEIAHLGEPPETYYAVRDDLRRALAGLTTGEQLRVLNDPLHPLTMEPDPEGVVPGTSNPPQATKR